jgi:DnaK suppressor protein
MLRQDELDQVEKRLKEERERALEALEVFDRQRNLSLQEQSGELSVYRFHMADIGTEAMEREKQFLLASNEGERLYQIDEALRQLYRTPESVGVCERCGQPIGMERLLVLPSTGHCARCAREVEEPV